MGCDYLHGRRDLRSRRRAVAYPRALLSMADASPNTRTASRSDARCDADHRSGPCIGLETLLADLECFQAERLPGPWLSPSPGPLTYARLFKSHRYEPAHTPGCLKTA